MSPIGQAAAAGSSTASPSIDDTAASRQAHTRNGNTVGASTCEKEASTTARVATRSETRAVPPLPDNAHVLHAPRSGLTSQPATPPSPYRPGPQILVNGSSDDSFVSSASATPLTSSPKKKKGKTEDEDQINTLDGLTTLLGEVVTTMKVYSGTPIVACFDALEAIATRLANHQTFPQAGDEREALGAVVSRTVSALVKELSLKKAPQLANPSPPASSPSSPSLYARAVNNAASFKTRNPPRDLSDERILVRFDGEVPPLLSQAYPIILRELNAKLAVFSLPELVGTQKHGEKAIFLVPASGEKEDCALLSSRWGEWGPSVLPGGRLVPPATYCFLQLDGVLFSGVDSLEVITRKFEQENPKLGKVVGTATWVNKPPSEAKVAAMAARGRRPPKAGSLFIRLGSKELVDLAVSKPHVVLGGTMVSVGRGFPHLRICQCWNCHKYRHMRSRCTSTLTCAGCGKEAHGPVCKEKPVCINCKRDHRADSFMCPTRKSIAANLQQQAFDLYRMLDETSKYRQSPADAASLLSPLTSALGLTNLPPHLAPRLCEQK
ncbi:hypothetical protein B0H16DRAFT_1738941 [Mycena metata]|uniref:Gag-like protein n=1 Tax=Mycena metata TaxID=1033252 RepID=A0AAD7MK64_9AGAR|nr:hypothetical protein B0H16DRAFT_1738941 [Mycena metata]